MLQAGHVDHQDLGHLGLLYHHRVLASLVFLLSPSNQVSHLDLADHLLPANPSHLQQLNIKVSTRYFTHI